MLNELFKSDTFVVIVGAVVFAVVIAFAVWFQTARSIKGIPMDAIRTAIYTIFCLVVLFVLAGSGIVRISLGSIASFLGLGFFSVFLIMTRTSTKVFGLSVAVIRVIIYILIFAMTYILYQGFYSK